MTTTTTTTTRGPLDKLITLRGNFMKGVDADGRCLFRLNYIAAKHGGGCEVWDLRTGYRADLTDDAGEAWFHATATAAALQAALS